jgi:gamma-D-glutamyl-L-lysine dipeptidyl-peptidase
MLTGSRPIPYNRCVPGKISQRYFDIFAKKNMEHAIVSVPAAAVRKKPSHRREMVSQLLFGEAVKVIREMSDLWVKVRSLLDNYEGWMPNTLLQQVTKEEASQYSEFVTASLFNTLQLNAIDMQIPWGASLPAFSNGKGRIGKLTYLFNGSFIKREDQVPGTELVNKLVMPWINAPYLWGGRTIYGVDCSGFVQVVYKMMGFDLPRDAWQQAQEGKTVKKLKEAVCGDLAFFDDKEEIVHVGILLNNEQIIHASGKVRIDNIDKKGIQRSDTGKRTHALRAIKRLY